MIDRGNQDWRPMSRPAVIFEAGAPRSGQFDDDITRRPTDLQKSLVYIEGGKIIERIEALKSGETLTILEPGIGTGLNLALLMQAWSFHAPPAARCHYIGVEKYPMSRSQLTEANAPWETLVDINDIIVSRWPPPIPGCHRRQSMMQGFTADFGGRCCGGAKRSCELPKPMDRCVVLGRFSPARNESMWGEAVMKQLSR